MNAFTLVYEIGSCCIYVVFMASNFKELSDYFLDTKTDIRLIMLIMLLPLILVNWVSLLRNSRTNAKLFIMHTDTERFSYFYPSVDQKFKIFGTAINDWNIVHHCFDYHCVLLHFSRTVNIRWGKECGGKSSRISILFRKCFICIGSDSCGKCTEWLQNLDPI